MSEEKKEVSKAESIAMELVDQERVRSGVRSFIKAVRKGFFPGEAGQHIPQGIKFLNGVLKGVEERIAELKGELRNVQKEDRNAAQGS